MPDENTQMWQRIEAVELMITVERALNIFFALHPSNAEEEKEKFLEERIDEPIFTYHPLEIPSCDFSFFQDDSAVGQLYTERIALTKDLCALIAARGDDEQFTQISEKIYPVEALTQKYKKPLQQEEGEYVATPDIVVQFRQAFTECGISDWEVVEQEHMSSRLSVVQLKKQLCIQAGLRLSKTELKGLIRHEIGAHVLRFARGQRQSEPLLHLGTVQGMLVEEGVAIYLENPQGLPRIFVRHAVVTFAKTHTFRETWESLVVSGETPENAWSITLRIKRGLSSGKSRGGFTRDALYAQGFERITQFVEDGGSLIDLLGAPIGIEERKLLIEQAGYTVPEILPHFLLH